VSLLGRGLILVALAACAIGAVLGITAGVRRSASGARHARWMAWTFAACTLGAVGLMEYALLTHDFSVGYVAQVGSLSTPVHITIVSLWSSLEGSILFWAAVLGVYTAGFAWTTRDRYPEHTSYAIGTLLVVGMFFTFLVAGVADPFLPVSPVPIDGPGPNPLLQNHVLMIIHPPSLYLGFVGMSVPFAMCVAALMAGRCDAAWLKHLRHWALVAWAWLSLGILLGGWWSYEVLGWGGYWAWDPVENASFLPWLVTTAFLHSAMLAERKQQLLSWTLVLGIASFLLTILGTFMTRSGVFNSVHSFTQSGIGPVFLGFLGLMLVGSVLLLAARMNLVSSHSKPIDDIVTKQGALLLNNLLLVGITFTVLVGVLYPLIVEAINGQRISVGQPYFNTMTLPLWVVMLFLMGVGPAFPWGRPTMDQIRKRLMIPGAVAAIVIVASLLLWGANPWATATFACAAFAGVVSFEEILAPGRARALATGETLIRATVNANRKARRRFSGHVVHLGIVTCAVAIAASSTFRTEQTYTIPVGETAVFEDYGLRYVGPQTIDEPHRTAEIAQFEVLRGDRVIGELAPRVNHYRENGQAIPTPAVQSGLLEDLYVSLIRVDQEAGTASIQVIKQPLVWWLWFGGLMVFGGGLLAAWPQRNSRAFAVAAKAAK
jgi:cytochrome c-type biogenesis protein CcmF